MQDRDEAREIRERVTGKVLTLDEALAPLLPALLALLGIPVESHAWRALDPRQRRRHIHDAIKRLVLRESLVQPLCLVFEDLHWIDDETQAVLDELVEGLPAARSLLLVNYRPGYRHAWGGKTYYGQARIDPLPEKSASELLGALLGAEASLAPLKSLLIERTAGNPFFIEECVRALVETSMLAGDPGRFHFARPLGSVRVPPTVQAVLAARIDRLTAEEKRLLQSASVVGKEVPLALLRAIAELPEDTLRGRLSRLQASEFLYESRLFPDLEYRFKHALTHEVAYSGLLHERRQALHLRILDALEARAPDGQAEDVESLAHHAVGAEVWDKAAVYLRRAGSRAVAQSAYREAAEWFEAALRAVNHLRESPEVLAQAVDVRLDLRVALIPLGQYEKALNLMREAEGLATRLGDLARLGLILADICARLRNVSGEHRQAIDVGRRALAIADELGDRALELEARYRIGQAYFAIGDYRQAIELLSRATQHAADQPRPVLYAHAWLALALANLGQFNEATSHAEEAFTIAERADHPFTLMEALTAVGGVHLARGNLDQAIRAQERGLRLAREWKLQPWAPLSGLAYAYALSGRLVEARRFLEEVVDGAPTIGATAGGRAIQLAWLGEAYLLDGQLDAASERAQQAVSLAPPRPLKPRRPRPARSRSS
jgi:predicted ATPase